MTGGGFAFHGGFWGGISVPALPRLDIRLGGSELIVSWPVSAGDAVVQSATRLLTGSGDWQRLPTEPIRVGDRFELIIDPSSLASDPVRFFRLAKP